MDELNEQVNELDGEDRVSAFVEPEVGPEEEETRDL